MIHEFYCDSLSKQCLCKLNHSKGLQCGDANDGSYRLDALLPSFHSNCCFYQYALMFCRIYFAGKNVTDEYLDGMIAEAPGPINFTMFLTMFGEKLTGTDPEDVIKNAFGCFDEEGTGM